MPRATSLLVGGPLSVLSHFPPLSPSLLPHYCVRTVILRIRNRPEQAGTTEQHQLALPQCSSCSSTCICTVCEWRTRLNKRKRERRKETGASKGTFAESGRPKKTRSTIPLLRQSGVAIVSSLPCILQPLVSFLHRTSLIFRFAFEFLTFYHLYPLLPSSRPRLHLALFAPSFPRYLWSLFPSFPLSPSPPSIQY